jgi:hypothetical protein
MNHEATRSNSSRQQQNQTNRDRALENASWSGQGISGEKGDGSDFAGPEGSNNVEGGADVNYMYNAGQPGHNGAGAGDSY